MTNGIMPVYVIFVSVLCQSAGEMKETHAHKRYVRYGAGCYRAGGGVLCVTSKQATSERVKAEGVCCEIK